ncbi:hypothetical protein [Jidongwangia harbinensis]|uniref:hypothetical protein n=1 Tax=Jidongwangia harbinensis TaxID=2878561 RepID=UPI001CD9A68A|nr:hypothetical protein [Jidongwangia harbinensis]MCA2219011.1 hypothetical protein [Jidongwangia harbinensis]
MFTVSENAINAIRQIVARPGVPQGAGLRIATNDGQVSLHVAVAPTSEPGNTVFQAASDAALFIAGDAEECVDDKIIDALIDDNGRVQFVLVSPAPDRRS